MWRKSPRGTEKTQETETTMERETFSYYLPPIYNTIPERDLTLREVWEYISGRELLDVGRRNQETGDITPLGNLRSVTEKVRSMPPEVYSDRKKGKVQFLPLVTFGGVFSKREGSGLREPSGLVLLDIDHISRLEGLSLEDLKERLSQDREIGLRLLFTSPSGDGLKIVCKTSGEITDPESYRREFETLNYFVSQKYSVPIGESGLDRNNSDITRGCLLCLDPTAVLRDWEDTFHPESHPLPEKKPDRPRKIERIDFVSSWDWDTFEQERIVPALFERVPEAFPDMGFKYNPRSERWESPLKRDGTPSKTPRQEKTFISRGKPWGVYEQGGDSIPIVKYYQDKNSLQYGEALRELSRLCGLEEEYKDLSRRYAKQMNKQETDMERNAPEDSRERPGQPAPKTQTETPSWNRKETQEEREERYRRDYLTTPSLQEIASTKREGLLTPYCFRNLEGGEERLLLTSGGLTIIGGQSSHGKSRFLQNLALQIATEEYNKGGEGVVLYFAFEETLLEIAERFANIQVNIPHISGYPTTKNTEVFRDYFKTGSLNKCPQGKRGEVLQKLSGFTTLYSQGRLRIYYTPELFSGDLCLLLEYLSSQMKIKAVFLDYIQAIYKEGNRKDRREELREISKDLNKIAKDLDLPIILSAQLNRETPSPTEMSGSNIAESQDIPRYADTVLLMWDSVRDRDLKDKEKYFGSTDYKEKLLGKLGFSFDKPGKLYTILDKNRGGSPYLEAVLEYVPETGVILSNIGDLPPGETGEQGETSGEFVQL